LALTTKAVPDKGMMIGYTCRTGTYRELWPNPKANSLLALNPLSKCEFLPISIRLVIPTKSKLA
jgi:hypothetical protein